MGLLIVVVAAWLSILVLCLTTSLKRAPHVSSRFRLYASHQESVERSHAERSTKFVVVTGGVISGIGKGVTASSIGVLLKMMNVLPTAIKIDPYLNVDAGTMSPHEHGEVFVLDDGAETDLRLTNDSNLTTGKVYQAVISKERRGDYLGKTVQIIPHITNEIIERMLAVSKRPVGDDGVEPDICVIELGGTIGDIESMAFVEAIRQLQVKVGSNNFCLVHVSMVPTVGESVEPKTKPTQHSVKELRSLGLSPDFIVCRAKQEVPAEAREKISLFCNVPLEHVLSMPDVPNIYHVPLKLLAQGFAPLLSAKLNLHTSQRSGLKEGLHRRGTVSASALRDWQDLVHRTDSATDEAVVALVGKYTNQLDAYLSVTSALKHACIATNQTLRLVMVESADLEDSVRETQPAVYEAAWTKLRSAHGVLVPGGFGTRGIEGKLSAVRHARENKVPFLGICLGMQAAVIEYARSVLGKTTAHSQEFMADLPQADSAIIFMPEGDKLAMGGTMRLGARKTLLSPSSRAATLYGGLTEVLERHRHRYEVNPSLVSSLESAGLRFSGRDESGQRMEVVELPEDVHPYFLGVQFHPEFVSRPLRPAPVFLGLLQAVKAKNLCRQR